MKRLRQTLYKGRAVKRTLLGIGLLLTIVAVA